MSTPALDWDTTTSLIADGITVYIDDQDERWVWSAFATRYVRTAEGARRYGVPIGSPIPSGRRNKAKTSTGGRGRGGSTSTSTSSPAPTAAPPRATNSTSTASSQRGAGAGRAPTLAANPAPRAGSSAPRASAGGRARVKLSPAQQAVADDVFGGTGAPASRSGGSLDVDDPRAAVEALDRIIARGDATPGRKRTLTALRNKIAKIDGGADDESAASRDPDTSDATPGTAPDGSLPGVDEAHVRRIAAAIDDAGRRAVADDPARIYSYGGGEAVKTAVREELRRHYPDARRATLESAERSVMNSLLREIDNKPGGPEPGRGTRGAVRAIEREQAFRGDSRDLNAWVQTARDALGGPDFRSESAPDGGPDETTLRRLAALRDAGAAISAVVGERIGARRAEVDAAREQHTRDLAAFRAADERLVAEMQTEWNARFGEDLPAVRLMEFRRAPDLQAAGGPGLPLTEDQAAARNAFYDQFRGRMRTAAVEVERLDQMQADTWAAREGLGAEEAQAYRDALAQVRRMGPHGNNALDWRFGDYVNPEQRERLTPMVQRAQATYPTDWLAANRARKGQMVITRGDSRGSYVSMWNGLEAATHDDDATQEHTVVHEMGHGMEAAVPALPEAEHAFLRDRISRGEPGGPRTFDEESVIYQGESGYLDDFRNQYTGKDYQPGQVAEAYEIFTTIVESMFAPSAKDRNYADLDSSHFALGAMALL